MAAPSPDIPIEDYEQSLAESVHFSVKTINTNIDKGGIRLSQDQALDLPYISARTLLADGLRIPTDYTANAGKTATHFKVIKAAMTDDAVVDTKGNPDPELQLIADALTPSIEQLFDAPYQSGLEHINPRMRQLLIPKDGSYISLSPITAAGVNYWLNDEIDAIKAQQKNNENDKRFRSPITAVFGIGGANPQNAGSLIRAMQRPIYLSAPTANEEVSQAFRLFYQGFDYYIPHKITIDKALTPALIKWVHLIKKDLKTTAQDPRQPWQEEGIFASKTDLSRRNAELAFLRQIVRNVLAQGKKAKQTLEHAKDKLPQITDLLADEDNPNLDKPLKQLTPLLHPSVDLAIQGLIDPTLRDEGWLQVFSKHLARQIVRQNYEVEGQSELVSFPIDDSAQGFLARRIRELLYTYGELV